MKYWVLVHATYGGELNRLYCACRARHPCGARAAPSVSRPGPARRRMSVTGSSHQARVTITVLEAEKRPVAAVADHLEVRRVREVNIAEDRSKAAKILFDPGHSLAERVLREQFRF